MIIEEATHLWQLKEFDELIKQEQLPAKYRNKTCYIYGELKPLTSGSTIDFDLGFYFTFVEEFEVGLECEMIAPEEFAKEIKAFNMGSKK